MLRLIPLSAITLVVYLVSSLLSGGHPLALPGDVSVPPWDWPLISVTLVSGVSWTATGGDGLVAAALVLLFLAVVRAANMAAPGMAPSILAVLSFALFVVAFLVLPGAATSTFFTLMLIALVEALSVTVISATRSKS